MLKKILCAAIVSTLGFSDCSDSTENQYKSLVLIGYAYEDYNTPLANLYYQDYLFWSAQVIAECYKHPKIVQQAIQTRKNMHDTFEEINNGK